MSYSEEYTIWQGIKRRCYKETCKAYPRYGGRGIKVSDRWLGEHGFENFLADMGNRPSKKHSIDRIDVNGNYEPSNCRWATDLEQGEHRRSNVYLTYNGETHKIADWARILGVTYHTIHKRYRRHKDDISKIIY